MKRIQTSLLVATLATSALVSAAPMWQEGLNYQGGEVVTSQQADYQCKEFPYSGWCGLSAYEPGVGFAWTDAWTRVSGDTCTPNVGLPMFSEKTIQHDTEQGSTHLYSDLFYGYRADGIVEIKKVGSGSVVQQGSQFTLAGSISTLELIGYIIADNGCGVETKQLMEVVAVTVESSSTVTPTPTPTAIVTPSTMPEFVLGVTKAANGSVYLYNGACFEAKNNPGVWESPREGWFWSQVSCSVTPVISCPPLAVPTPLDISRNEVLASNEVRRLKVADLLAAGNNVELASLTVSGDAYLEGDELVLNPTDGTVVLAQRYQLDSCRGGGYSDTYISQRVIISVSLTTRVSPTPLPSLLPSCLPLAIPAPLDETINITDIAAPGFDVSSALFGQGGDPSTLTFETSGSTVVNQLDGRYYVDGVGTARFSISKYIGHPEKGCPGYNLTDYLTVNVAPVAGTRTPVIAYQPSWAFNLNAIQWDKLTHINYSFALPDADGSLKIEAPQNLQALSNAAVGKDTEIWLAIGGWTIGDGGGNDADWSTIVSNRQLLDRFKGEIQTAIDTYNLGGIDIDWEWPNNNSEKALYLQLMQELDVMLEAQGKGLSTAVISRGANGQYVDSKVFELVDFFNLMAYDDNWPWSGDNKHSDMAVAQASLDYWVNQRGVPAEKTILGVPFYCRGNNQSISYEQLLNSGADPDADAHQGCYYNGRVTMKAKAELAKQRAAGVMFWELSQDVEDNRSLLTVIDSVLNP